jgi:hypothetical protein
MRAKLSQQQINHNIASAKTIAPNFVAGDLVDTIDLLADRLNLGIHRAHRPRIDEVKRFVRLHYNARSAVDLFLIDIASEAFLGGIEEARGETYVPNNARTAALLDQVRARLADTAALEAENL